MESKISQTEPTVTCDECNGDSRGYFVPSGTSGYFVRCSRCDGDGWLFSEDAGDLAESRRLADKLSDLLCAVRAGIGSAEAERWHLDRAHAEWFHSAARAR